MRAWLWRFTFALVVASVLATCGVVGGSWYLDHQFTKAKEVAVRLDAEARGPMNFLLLGSDSRAFVNEDQDERSFGDEGEVGGQRADAIMVLRVEPDSHVGLLVSFPRDLRVTYPDRKGYHRINEAFDDGPQGVVDVIQANFDIPIHHYLEVDFAGFRSMVDAIGGVKMYVPSPVRDRKTGLSVPEPGCATLDGTQALAWVRSRFFQYQENGKWRSDPRSDLGRIERQQEFIRRLMSQAMAKGATHPLRANRLANAALRNLTVDAEFHVKDALRLVQAFRTVGPAAVEMMALPVRSVAYGLRPTSEADAVVARLRGAGEDTGEDGGRPSTPATPAGVRVRILNGAGVAGLAGKTTRQLTGLGFNATQPADADHFYSRTEIRYLPTSEHKVELLARYTGGVGKLVPDAKLGNLDVVVIVGKDWKTITAKPGPARNAPAASTTTTSSTTTTTVAPPPSTAPPATPEGAAPQPAC
jgi:LCP family protein required for cell wall assembly